MSSDGDYIGADKPFRQDMEQATADGDPSVSLSTSFQAIPCSVNRANLSNFIDKDGEGFEFSKAGFVLLFGSVYCSDLTAGDVVSVSFYRYRGNGSTQGMASRVGATKTTVTAHAIPTVFSVEPGDVVKIAAANLTSARGTAGGSISTTMTAIYLR